MKVLIVDDNQRLVDRMNFRLRKWFVIDTVSSGHDALVAIESDTFDIVLLDLGLPDMHGREVCRRIRSISTVPILVLTGANEIDSVVDLLNNGADDYMTKPFDAQELRARINALLRRRSTTVTATLTVEDLVIDPATHTVYRGETPITLRRKEFDILEYLAINKGRVVSRDMIIHHAWSTTAGAWVGSVDVHIKHIRDKIDKPFPTPLLKTVYGVGFMLGPPEAPPSDGTINAAQKHNL